MNVRTGVLVTETEEDETVAVPVVELVLSERNLRTLLMNIADEDNSVVRYTEEGVLFVIRGETNEIHYKDRSAGLMDDETETKLLADELDSDVPLVIPEDFGNTLN